MSDSKLVVLFVVPDTDTALVAILKAWRWVLVSLVCIRQIPQTCEHRCCRLTALFTAQYGATTFQQIVQSLLASVTAALLFIIHSKYYV